MPLETHLPSLEEIRAVAGACSRRAPTGVRNRALVLVLAATGLRISEALSLKPSNYDRDRGWLQIVRGKGGKGRIAVIGLPEAQDALDHWLERRKSMGINDHRRIFCTLRGEPLMTSYTRALFPRLAKKVGVQGRVHAHALRHYFTVALAEAQCPIAHIQVALGHSSLTTTSRYLRRIGPTDTAEAVKAAFRRTLTT